MKFIEFLPIYKERVWGGRRFEEKFGRKLPDKREYGESWEIVDREGDQSIVSNGIWKGLTLREILEKEGDYIMGIGWEKDRRFPILVKWLDCRERLSLQVHPPKEIAESLGGQSKTENWYIAEADSEAHVLVGVKKEVSPDFFLKALEKGNVEELLCKLPTEKGDSLFIPSGRLHAIGEGNLILEIQENSDTTYRVHDWGRLGMDGKLREIHIKESMMSIDFKDTGIKKIRACKGNDKNCMLVNCKEFRINKWMVNTADKIELRSGEGPRILSVIEGKLFITDLDGSAIIRAGSSVLLPNKESFFLETDDNCIMLITDKFVSI